MLSPALSCDSSRQRARGSCQGLGLLSDTAAQARDTQPASPVSRASVSRHSLCVGLAVGPSSLCPVILDVSTPELVHLEPLGRCWQQPLGSWDGGGLGPSARSGWTRGGPGCHLVRLGLALASLGSGTGLIRGLTRSLAGPASRRVPHLDFTAGRVLGWVGPTVGLRTWKPPVLSPLPLWLWESPLGSLSVSVAPRLGPAQSSAQRPAPTNTLGNRMAVTVGCVGSPRLGLGLHSPTAL